MPRSTHEILERQVQQIGDQSVHVVTRPGSFENGINKDGSSAMLHYGAGSFLLRDDRRDCVMVGPTDLQGAAELATATIEGNPRAINEPQALLVLAVSVIALAGNAQGPQDLAIAPATVDERADALIEKARDLGYGGEQLASWVIGELMLADPWLRLDQATTRYQQAIGGR